MYHYIPLDVVKLFTFWDWRYSIDIKVYALFVNDLSLIPVVMEISDHHWLAKMAQEITTSLTGPE